MCVHCFVVEIGYFGFGLCFFFLFVWLFGCLVGPLVDKGSMILCIVSNTPYLQGVEYSEMVDKIPL